MDKCPNCGHFLVHDDFGDDDCPKYFIICNKCNYKKRISYQEWLKS